MFRSEAYQQLLGKVHKGEKITQHITPIAIDKIRVVDEELAYFLVHDKKHISLKINKIKNLKLG